MKKEAKKRPFSGAAGRTCSFSGDAPLRRYQRRPLPNKETGVLRRRAKRFVPTKRLPPSSPSRIHIIIQNPDFSTRIRGFVVPLAGLEPARSLNRGILSNYRNEVIESFAEKIRENRGKKEFLVAKSVEKRSIAVTFGVRKSKQE